MKGYVALLSGGMDSTTLAYLFARRTGNLHLISVNYGQRHRKELEFAKLTATRLKAVHQIVDLSAVQQLLAGSSLTSDDVPVPEGHYAAETMKATVVPNRNLILLSLAAGYAVSRGLSVIGYAAHAGDHFIYPDCRPEFVAAASMAIEQGNKGFGNDLEIEAPFLRWSKADIVSEGQFLEVPWTETWSCYAGGDVHCGRCGTCVERKEAFQLADVPDPTVYET